jgi:hypothetical protein
MKPRRKELVSKQIFEENHRNINAPSTAESITSGKPVVAG